MSITQLKVFASTIIAVSLLVTACSKNADSENVASQFVRLYFVEDNLAGAVKLTSGSARGRLEGLMGDMEAIGGKEPGAEKPSVKVKFVESQTDAGDQMLYIYQVTPAVEVEGMEPVTVRIWLNKEDNTWYVSKFIQEE